MFRTTSIAMALLAWTVAATPASSANEPKPLLARIAEWRYPDAKINESTMSDAATVDAKGDRTAPSLQCRTMMTTADPITKVVNYYKAKLLLDAAAGKAIPDDKTGAVFPRAVTFHNDSADRPVAIHIIVVNTEKTSTTLVISRADTEPETHVAWTQYERF